MMWLDWLKMNWGWIAGAAVLIASVLNLITSHFGTANPRLKRWLLFLVDLLAILVSRGSTAGPGRVGGLSALKLPLIQTSPAPESKWRAGSVISKVGLVLLLLLVGCAGWQNKTRVGLDSVSLLVSYAPAAIMTQCEAAQKKCVGEMDRKCEELRACGEDAKKASKVRVAVQSTVLAGLAAIEIGDEPTATKMLIEAQQLAEPVKLTLKAYGVLP